MDNHDACSMRKQPIFRDATPRFPAKWRLTDECRHSIMMKFHDPDLGSAFDWLKQIFSHRRTTQIRVVSRRQYRISALVSQTPLRGEISGGLTKCWLFPQPMVLVLRLVHKGDFRPIVRNFMKAIDRQFTTQEVRKPLPWLSRFFTRCTLR